MGANLKTGFSSQQRCENLTKQMNTFPVSDQWLNRCCVWAICASIMSFNYGCLSLFPWEMRKKRRKHRDDKEGLIAQVLHNKSTGWQTPGPVVTSTFRARSGACVFFCLRAPGRGGRWRGWAIFSRLFRSSHLLWSTVRRAVPWWREANFNQSWLSSSLFSASCVGETALNSCRACPHGSSHLVLVEIGDDHADKQSEPNHATQEDKNVDVDAMNLQTQRKFIR